MSMTSLCAMIKAESWSSFYERNSLALSPSDEIKKIYNEKGAGIVPCLLALTPLGSEAIFYKNPAEWNRFRPTSPLEETPLSSPIGIAQHLFMNTYSFNAVTSRWCDQSTDLKSLKKMFSAEPVKRTGNTGFYHGVAQMRVLDRVAWALEELTEADEWHQEDSPADDTANGSEELPPPIKAAIASCTKWRTLLVKFSQGWILREKEKELNGLAGLPVGDTGDGRKTMAALGRCMGTSSNESYINRVVANFAAAALGLNALAQVSLQRK